MLLTIISTALDIRIDPVEDIPYAKKVNNLPGLWANVDFPEPGRPVNQTMADLWPLTRSLSSFLMIPS